MDGMLGLDSMWPMDFETSPALQQTNGLPPQMTAQAPASMMAPNGQPLGMLNNGGGGDGFNMPPPSPWPAPMAAPPMPHAAPGMAMAASAPAPQQQPSAPQPPADVPETSLAGRLFGGAGDFINNHRSTLAAVGASMIGAQPGQIGQRLSATIGPATQADIRQGQQNMTVAALMKRGMPQDVAIAAATNPAIMSQLLPQLFGAKQLTPTPIGTDVLGHPIHGSFNPVTGKYYDVSGREVGANGQPVGGAPGNVGGVGGIGSTNPQQWAAMAPEDRLKTIDPQVAGEIQAIYEGRQSGTGRNVQQLLPLVNQVYPDFTMQDYKQRSEAMHDFYGGGKSQQTVKNLNQFVGHLGSLTESVDQQGNTRFPAVNYVKNEGGQMLGYTGANPVVTKAHAAADELAALFKGQGISDTEIQQWKKSFRENGSPAQQREDVATLMDLAGHSIDALEKKRVDGLGQTLAARMPGIVDPKTQANIDRIKAWATTGVPQQQAPAPAAPQAPTTPAPGEVRDGYRYKGGNPADPHSWEPVT